MRVRVLLFTVARQQRIENKSGSRCSCVREEELRPRQQAQDPIDCQSTIFVLVFSLFSCRVSVLFTEKTSSAFEEE